MKIQDWVERLAESSRARVLSFFFFIILVGSFAFWAFHTDANLAAAHESQVSLAQQNQDLRAAASMNDLYSQGWLADDQNFSKLAGYVGKLVHLSAIPSLDPNFKQELSDYILNNQSQLPKEAEQIETLSFSEGILRQDQSRLLDMYDQLSLVFRTMEEIVAGWDVDTPQRRGEKMITIQDAFSTASVEFQATTKSHRQILNYAKLLDERSKQASTTGRGRIHAYRTQLTLSIIGLIASMFGFAGWVIFLKRAGSREQEEEAPV